MMAFLHILPSVCTVCSQTPITVLSGFVLGFVFFSLSHHQCASHLSRAVCICVLEGDVHSGAFIHALQVKVIPANWLGMGRVNSSIVTVYDDAHLPQISAD